MNIPFLEQTLRWFGPNDVVKLADIRQAGATGVVTALHQVPCGELWTADEIRRRKGEIEAAGLRWSVVESVPVHEEIKRNCGNCERYLQNYCQSLRNLASFGITTVCYNFMAATDWTRTNVSWIRPDGSEVSRFDMVDAAAFDVLVLKRKGAELSYTPAMVEAGARRWEGLSQTERDRICRSILMGLPGTVDDLSVEQFREGLQLYAELGAAGLRLSMKKFLDRVVPVAEEHGIRLAIHPDDPPFSVFGLPRLAGTEADLRALVAMYDSPANGITFCTGSLGALRTNDLPGILHRLGDRVHFLHLRSVGVEPDGSFIESDHLTGGADMPVIMAEAIDLMARRGTSLPMRPDHGARMLGDLDNDHFYPGYSAIGRLRGLAELRGLERGLRHHRRLSEPRR